jgi:hypothetical protein
MAPGAAASCLFKWRKNIWDSPRAFEAPGTYNRDHIRFLWAIWQRKIIIC